MSSRLILLVLLAAGCTRWRPAPVAPDQMVAATHPKRIRVTLADSSVLVLKHPAISADSIAGKSFGMRIAVPSARIVRTEVPVPPEAAPGFLSSWRTQRRAPQQVISKKRPERVRLTLTDSSVLVLEHPVSVGDSVIGLVSGTPTAVASGRIARTEIRVENPWKMIGFVSLSAALYFALCRDTPDCPNRVLP